MHYFSVTQTWTTPLPGAVHASAGQIKMNVASDTKKRTHSAGGATSAGDDGRRQLLVAGEGVQSRGRDMSVVLSGQVLQIQLHVHVFGRVAARELHVVGQQLALQLVLSEHRRVVQVLRHVGVRGRQLPSPG